MHAHAIVFEGMAPAKPPFRQGCAKPFDEFAPHSKEQQGYDVAGGFDRACGRGCMAVKSAGQRAQPHALPLSLAMFDYCSSGWQRQRLVYVLAICFMIVFVCWMRCLRLLLLQAGLGAPALHRGRLARRRLPLIGGVTVGGSAGRLHESRQRRSCIRSRTLQETRRVLQVACALAPEGVDKEEGRWVG